MGTEQTVCTVNAGKTESEEREMPMKVLDGTGRQASEAKKETAETKQETMETKRMREKFGFFGPAAFLYAVFYTFCMFKNGSGITFPFFVAGSLLFLCLSLAKLEITLKKGSVFYMAAMVLLGISTFCTDDIRIISLNKLGIFLLMMSLLLKQFFDTGKWGPGKFLISICRLVCGAVGEMAQPFQDAADYRKKKDGEADCRIWAVGLGLLAGIPLLLVMLVLLSSADALFRQITGDLSKGITAENTVNVFSRVIFLFLAAYCLTSWLCKRGSGRK